MREVDPSDGEALWIAETTVPDEAMARTLADALVARRLAACVHVDRIESVYRWKGVVEREAEWRLVIKTVRDRPSDVRTTIAEAHSYDVFAYFAWPVAIVDEAYAEWARAETS